MIVVRTVFNGKFGSGGELAAAMVEEMKSMDKAGAPQGFHSWRILTDRSGPFDTVTMEAVVDSIGVWEAARDAMFAEPGFSESMEKTAALIEGGSQEFLYIEAEG